MRISMRALLGVAGMIVLLAIGWAIAMQASNAGTRAGAAMGNQFRADYPPDDGAPGPTDPNGPRN